tara:strand:+ start:108 stop:305 length:198 start_codon:yes stop_codon:yes gene_type:complete
MKINIEHKIHHRTAIKAIEHYLNNCSKAHRRIVLKDLAKHGLYTVDTFLDAYDLSASPKTIEGED